MSGKYTELIDRLIATGKPPANDTQPQQDKFATRDNEPNATADMWISGEDGIARGDKKFFAVRGVNRPGGNLQPLVIEQSDAYTEEACMAEVGRLILPVRGEFPTPEFALSTSNGYGSFGKTMFTAPRCSLSNPNQVEAAAIDAVETDGVREKVYRFEYASPLSFANVNRIAGRFRARITDISDVTGLNEDSIVWFPVTAVPELLDHELMTDFPTREMLTRLMLWYAMAHAFSVFNDYDDFYQDARDEVFTRRDGEVDDEMVPSDEERS